MAAPVNDAPIAPSVAAEWLDRWDAQQEGYVADREERFAVLADIVAAAVDGVPNPLVVDLGCGPGSLAARLATRLPGATFVGVDADPLLLGLARSHYGSLATWVRADLADPSWADALPGPIHAAVSTTALHWLLPDRLAALYRTLAEHTAPGGVFANGDHLGLADDGLAALGDAVGAGRAVRAGVAGREEWGDWWDAALHDERLAAIAAGRARPRAASTLANDAPDTGDAHAHSTDAHSTDEHSTDEHSTDGAEHHHGSNRLSVTDHVRLLRAAGYSAAAPLWQVGDDQIVVARC
ncbi:MAG TPA: class I SAM-dependent methyltransferase [Pseudonocardia sp.]|jgi:SAM-dependent methyltransferase|nr:class I SAM-dependent methyltransferase [Pseudonocardia sp.]